MTGGRVRRLVQLVSLLLLATSAVMLGGGFTAASASGSLKSDATVLQSAWYWQNAYEQANPPVAQSLPTSEPSGVPPGDLAVAHTSQDASSSKMTVLAFDTGVLTPGTIINDFTVTLTVDSAPPAANANSAAAPVVACLPTRGWAPAEGGDYTDEPPVDCTSKVKPKIDGSTYTFSIPTIAQSWVDDQNLGVAFVNDPENKTPFQVVFSGAKTVKASMTYTPATTTGTTGSGSTGGTTLGGTTSTGTTSSGPVSAPPPNISTGTTTAPVPAQAPQVATTTPTTTLPVAKVAAASSAPTTGFWIAAGALALVVLLVSMVLGDATLAATSAPTSRLDRVLRGGPGQPSLSSPRG